MSFQPLDNPLNADDLKEKAKQAAIQQVQTALVNKVAGAIGKKAGKLAKVLPAAQQVYSMKDQLGRSPSITPTNIIASNGRVQPDTQPSPAPVPAEPPSASQVAASLLPVLVGCDVNINGIVINPILDLYISQVHGDHNKLEIHFPHRLIQENTFTMENSQSLLGKVAEVSIKNRNDEGSAPLENHFVITSVTLEQNRLNDGILVAIGYSPTILLDGAPHYESFHKKTLKDIATIIGKPLQQAKGSITADPTLTNTLIYTCRYNESAWNFLKRLSAETGQWLYYNGTSLIFGKPEKGKAVELIYGSNCYDLRSRVQAGPVQTSLFDYNAPAHTPLTGPAASYTGNAGSYAEKAFTKSKEMYGMPTYAMPYFLDADKSVVEAIGKARSAGRAAGMYVMSGESAIYGLRVGALVDVSFKRFDESAAHSQMRIIAVSHHLNASGNYTNSFEAVSATAEMPPPPQFMKPVTYPMLAVVLSNKDPENQGRIQVQFMGWQQNHSSQQTDWIRVLTPDAGGGGEKVAKNRGLVTVPEVGDQVMIDFEAGNPDRPFVTGSIFHGVHGAGGNTGNNFKSLTSKSGHTIILNDGEGITVKDKNDNTIHVDGAGNISATSSNTNSTNVGEGKATIKMDKGGNIYMEGKKKIELKVGSSILTITPDTISLTAQKNNITGINHLNGKQTTIDGGNVFIN